MPPPLWKILSELLLFLDIGSFQEICDVLFIEFDTTMLSLGRKKFFF
jgi:hypothetical protein